MSGRLRRTARCVIPPAPVTEQMSTITTERFAGLGPLDRPRLFTQTRDFRFHGREGTLVHRKITCGPKGYTLVASVSTGHDTCFVEQERTSLTLPLTGRLDVRVAGRTLITAPGGLVAIGPSERRSSHFAKDNTGRYASYTIISPSQPAGVLGSECWLHRPRLRTFLHLKHVIEIAFRLFDTEHDMSARRLAHAGALIEDVFVEALAPPGDIDNADPDVHWYEWIVRTAHAYMEAHHHLPASIPDIAGWLGVGTRTLQAAFRNRRGTTPKRVLTEIRLRAMRARLTCPGPDTTVTSAALDSGIFHVGRCINVYRKRFGESPATTLRRSRIAARRGRSLASAAGRGGLIAT